MRGIPFRWRVLGCSMLVLATSWVWIPACGDETKPASRAIGSRLEPLVDRYLIAELRGVEHVSARPIDAGIAVPFDQPWEGAFCGYCTVIKDGPLYRLYYRGLPKAGRDGSNTETTCYAESKDGKTFTKPKLGLFEVMGSKENNVILADAAPFSHNFSPFLDSRPDVPKDQRYKALAGTSSTGLVAWVSEDGLRWRKLQDEAVIQGGAFDSQNLAFWSSTENCYVSYFRTFKRIGGEGYRWISRTTSKDFVHWTPAEEMTFGGAPPEHLYTNQTSPYYRAPHLYVAIAARFMPGRKVLTDEQAREIQVDPGYFNDCSDGVMLTSRGGNAYDRTFMEGFVRPGIGPTNWVSRTSYPALNVVPTGEEEMSLYVSQSYGQPTAHLRRYTLRPDGFASVRATYSGGEFTTHPLTFDGSRLTVNFATSAAGGIKVEIQDEDGAPLPGFALEESVELIGNDLAREVRWQSGNDLSSLANKVIKLRFSMKDADLYALQFTSPPTPTKK
ncbi:MAG: hypothetical protein U1D30_16375 [Planctomycetota bacterium]